MNDKTTRWENVKGRAQWLNDNTGAVEWLREFGGTPPTSGAEFAMALCEEMDRMQEEVDFLRERVDRLASVEASETGRMQEDIKQLQRQVSELNDRGKTT